MLYLFEVEFASTLGVTMEEVNYDGVIRTYSLIEEDHQRVRTVQFNSSNNDVTCSCKMFDSLGLLCRHALQVINVKNITQVPTQYILKRWTKYAKKESVLYNPAELSHMNNEMSVTVRRNELMRSVYDIFSRSAETTRYTEMCKKKSEGAGRIY